MTCPNNDGEMVDIGVSGLYGPNRLECSVCKSTFDPK